MSDLERVLWLVNLYKDDIEQGQTTMDLISELKDILID